MTFGLIFSIFFLGFQFNDISNFECITDLAALDLTHSGTHYGCESYLAGGFRPRETNMR